MRLVITGCLSFIGFLLAPTVRGDTTLPPSAPLIYTVSTASAAVDASPLGLVADLIGEAYRKSHEKFLDALRLSTDDSSKKESLLRPLTCLGFDPSTEECRRSLEVKPGISDQELIKVLRDEPTRSARVVELRIVFDGRFFQVPSRLYDVQLTEGNKLVRIHELEAAYIRTYSRTLHAEDIATNRNDTPFNGKIGSKEARMHFWYGGSSPRLPTELANSLKALADLWGATLSPDAVGVLAGDHSDRASLPRVRDVVAKDSVPCKVLHSNLLVAKDLGDYLWLTFPGKQKDLWNNFFIEPRCGFDY